MPRVMTSLLMSFLTISSLHRLFDADCRIPGTWLQALLPFPTPPQEGARELAHRLVMRGSVGGRRLPLTVSIPALDICALTYQNIVLLIKTITKFSNLIGDHGSLTTDCTTNVFPKYRFFKGNNIRESAKLSNTCVCLKFGVLK